MAPRSEGLVPEGSRIKVTLKDGKVLVGVVEHCSPTGMSCRVLPDGSEELEKVNLTKCAYELLAADEATTDVTLAGAEPDEDKEESEEEGGQSEDGDGEGEESEGEDVEGDEGGDEGDEQEGAKKQGGEPAAAEPSSPAASVDSMPSDFEALNELSSDEGSEVEGAKKQAPAKAKPQKREKEEEKRSGSDEGDENGSGDGDEGDENGSGDGDEGDENGSDGNGEDASDASTPDSFPPAAAAPIDAFLSASAPGPAAFASASEHLASLARSALAALHSQLASSLEGSGGKLPAGAFAELFTEGFDAEQLWMQLEPLDAAALRRAKKLVSKAGAAPRVLSAEDERDIDILLGEGGEEEDEDLGEESQGEGDEDEGEGEDEESGDESDEGNEFAAMLKAGEKQANGKKESEDEGEEEDDDDEGSEEGSEEEDDDEDEESANPFARASSKALSAKERSVRAQLEDEHFKLDDMERFVRQAEEEEARRSRRGGGSASDSESEEDEFDENAGAENDDEDDEEQDEEAALEAALDGRPLGATLGRRARKRQGLPAARGGAAGAPDDDEEDDEDATTSDDEDAGQGNVRGETAMFEDLFGPRADEAPRKGAGASARGGEADDGESDDDDDEAWMRGPKGAEDEDEEDEEDEDEGEEATLGSRAAKAAPGSGAAPPSSSGSEPQSTHESRAARLARRIETLEDEALAEKEWFLRGEAWARDRPLDSALEVDLDFETTTVPSEPVTAEVTSSIEDLIKRRIADASFDDPAPPSSAVALAEQAGGRRADSRPEIDETKSAKGLAELYEEDYLKSREAAAAAQAGEPVKSVREELEAPKRAEAEAVFAELCSRLDALSHAAFAPLDALEEIAERQAAGARAAKDLPAIFMEDAAPEAGALAPAMAAGAALALAPEQLAAPLRAGADGSTARAESELSREDRKRRRAAKKRVRRRKTAEADAARASREGAPGGRKSERAEIREAERKLAERAKGRGKRGAPREETQRKKGHYAKSASVFAQIQAAGAKGDGADAKPKGASGKALKL